MATSNVSEFSKKFIENIPSKYRSDYYLKGQKLYRKSTKTPIFDVKPIERLIPNRTFGKLGRGELPISSAAKKLKLTKRGLKYNNKPSVDLIGTPTQKMVKVGGIKLTSFGEQTTRKAFGTIQVIIERNFKRAKDPSKFR